MHEHDQFDPNCRGCRPCVIDMKTGKVMTDNHPTMVIINRVFDAAPLEEQEAFFRVTVKNSRALNDSVLLNRLNEKFKAAMAS